MADNDQNFSPDSSSDDLFERGRQMGLKLPPEHAMSLIQQITAGKLMPQGVQNSNLGTASTDPAPADQTMTDLGRTPAAAPPATIRSIAMSQRAASPLDRSQVDPALDNQNVDVQKLRDMADHLEGSPTQLNLSPIAAFVDAQTGSHFSPMAQAMAPMSPDQKDQAVAKLRAMAAGADNSVAKQEAALALGNQKNQLAQLRVLAGVKDPNNTQLAPKDLDNDTQKFAVAMNAYKDARNTVTNIAQKEATATKLAALMDRYKSGNQLNDTQLQELATGVANLLTTSNSAVAQEQIKKLAPYAGGQDFSHLQAYIVNHPVDAGLDQWVDMYGSIVQSEKATAEAQLKDIHERVIPGFQSLWEDPNGKDRVYRISRGNGISGKEVDSIFNNDADMPSKVGLPYVGQKGGYYTTQVAPLAANQQTMSSTGVPIGAAAPPAAAYPEPPGFKGDWNKLSPAGKKLYYDHHNNLGQ